MRRFSKRRLVVIGIIVFFAMGVALTLYAFYRSHPPVAISKENRGRFARVAILMDGTRSVDADGTGNFVLIKQIVEKKILPSLGVHDVVVGYDVHPDFSNPQNAVIGLWEDQPPQDSEIPRREILDILHRNRKSKVHDEDLYDLIRALAPHWQSVEKVRSTWAQRVQAREQPKEKENRRGSDLCSPLREIATFLRRGDPAAERWLFVMSDFRNEVLTENQRLTCHAKEPFPEANILLIYPLDSDHPGWQALEGFWQSFFGDQELGMASLSALADGVLLPPNPVAGLERYEIKTAWGYARPLLLPVLVFCIVPTLAIWLTVELTHGRTGPAEEETDPAAQRSRPAEWNVEKELP